MKPIEVEYRQGGMREFQETGVYPIKLLVRDPNLNKRWQRKITEEKNSGEFKIGQEVIYTYHVNLDKSEVRIFDNKGKLVTNCVEMHEMRD